MARCILFGLVALVGMLCAAGCSQGDVIDADDERIAQLQALQSLLTGTLSLSLRFSDGGTDSLGQFSSGASAIVLSGVNYWRVERLELGIARPFAAREALPTLGHETVGSGAAQRLSIQLDLTVQPLASGALGSGIDSGGRPFHATDLSTTVPAGTYTGAVLHIREYIQTGTVAGSSFGVLGSTAFDLQATTRCFAAVPVAGTATLRLLFDYAQLYGNLPSANSTGVATALAANTAAGAGGILREHECFAL